MKNAYLVDCSEFEIDGILKAAIVNAVTRIEKGVSRKERSELRKFILECARILESFQKQEKNPETFLGNMQQQPQQPN